MEQEISAAPEPAPYAAPQPGAEAEAVKVEAPKAESKKTKRAPAIPDTPWEPPTTEPTHLVETALEDWRKTASDLRNLAVALGLSKSEISRRADIPIGTLSPWYDGTYNGSFANITARARRWIDTEQHVQKTTTGGLQEPAWVETRTAVEVMNALLYAQNAPAAVIISLGAGIGKTTVAKRYVATKPNAWRVVMRPSTGRVLPTLRAIAYQLNLPAKKATIDKLSFSLGEKLQRNGRRTLLIVDEAQYLSDEAVNELRFYMDEFGCGLALLGNEEVSTRWGGASPRENQAQVHRRIGKRIRRLTPYAEDIEAYVDAWNFDDPKIAELARAIGKKPGALGQIAESVKQASIIAAGAGRAMTVEDLRAAWSNRGGDM